MQSIDKRLAKKLIRYLAFWLLAFAKVSNICYKNAKLILYLIRDLSKIQYFWSTIVFMDEPKSLLYNNVFFYIFLPTRNNDRKIERIAQKMIFLTPSF